MKRLINRIARLTALVAVVAAAVLASCSKEPAELTPQGDDRVIRIASTTIGVPTAGGEGTPAPNSASSPAPAPEPNSRAMTTTVMENIYFYYKHAATTPTNMGSGAGSAIGSRAQTTAGAITWTGRHRPLYEMKNGLNTYLVGLHPYTSPDATGPATAAATIEWAIDGKTDVMTTGIVSAGSYAAPATASMNFVHRLAALEVIVEFEAAVSGEIINGLWGELTAIELVGTAQKATYTASTHIVNFSTITEIPLRKGASYEEPFETMAIPTFGTMAVCASGMFAPTGGTTPITLRLHTTVGVPIDVTVQLKSGTTPKGFGSGNKHTATLLLSVVDRKVRVESTSIAPWGTGGESGGSVLPPAQTNTPSMGYLDWNYSGLVKTGVFNDQTYAIPTFTDQSYNTFTATANGQKCTQISECIDRERPFRALEIAKTDETETKTWAAAYAACKAKAPAGAWRLPRMTELLQIYMNKTELSKTTGLTFLSNTAAYWSATEFDADNAWCEDYTHVGQPYPAYRNIYHSLAKTTTMKVRCVRELGHHAIGNLRDGGIVYWVDPADATKYKVFSLDQGSSLTWSSKNTYVLGTAGQSLTDGKANVDAMKDYSANNKTNNDATKQTTGFFVTDFPAAEFCDRKNTGGVTGWYLPATDELEAFYTAYKANQIVLDGAITTNLGTAIPDSGTFWSSTENSSNTNRAWYVSLSNGGTYDNGSKNANSYVRCVRSTVPSPPAIGDLRDGGIVYWVNATDPTKYKVFSLDQGASLKWSPKNTYVLGAAGQSLTDGKANVDAMKDYSANNKTNNDATKQTTGVFATDFPAAAFCDRKNTGGVTGWYLPAKDELVELSQAYRDNTTVLNGAITANSGTAFPANGYFWSSTEGSNYTGYACYVGFSGGNTSYTGKINGYYVRCVRAN